MVFDLKNKNDKSKRPIIIGTNGNTFTAEIPTDQTLEETLTDSVSRTDRELSPLKLFHSYLAQYHGETIPIEEFVKELEKFIRDEASNVVFTALKGNPIVKKQLEQRVVPSYAISLIKTAINKKESIEYSHLITFLIDILKPKMKPILQALFDKDLDELLFHYAPKREYENWCRRAMMEGKVKIASRKQLFEIDNFLEQDALQMIKEKRIKEIVKFLEVREPLWRAHPEKFTQLYNIIKETNTIPWEILDFWFNSV